MMREWSISVSRQSNSCTIFNLIIETIIGCPTLARFVLIRFGAHSMRDVLNGMCQDEANLKAQAEQTTPSFLLQCVVWDNLL